MRLKHVSFLVLISCLHVFGSGHAQRVTLSVKNSGILDVMEQIEKQTGYSFWLQTDLIRDRERINLRVKNAALTNVLDQLLSKYNLGYTLIEKTIVVSPRKMTSTADTEGAAPLAPLEIRPPAGDVRWPDKPEYGERLAENEAGNEQEIRGKVFDESGAGLPGVSVMIKGTQRGVSTDAEGGFTLAVPDENTILVFSFVGYTTQEIVAGKKSSLSVTLDPDLKSLEELVVIGYGAVKKRDLTGSVSQVSGKEINAFPTSNVVQALAGRSAGVHVLQSTGAPGAEINVRIRGTNSIQGGNEPLYVIDGFPYSGNPTNLNNADVESIEVLKDASATAIYGSRGANGVVLITTKRGKEGASMIDFESSFSSQSVIRKMDLMDAREYATFYNVQQRNDTGKDFFTSDQIAGFGRGIDWQDMIFRSAPILSNTLNITSGTSKTKFSLSGSTFNQQGVIKRSDYNRYSFRTNLDHRFSKFFSASLSSMFTRISTDRKDSGGGSRGASLIGSTLGASPTFTPYKEDGSYRLLRIGYPFVATDIYNPLNMLNEQTTEKRESKFLLNGALVFNPIKQITVRVSGGLESNFDRNDFYATTRDETSNGNAGISLGEYVSLLNENTVSFDETYGGKHSVSAVAGFTYQDFVSKGVSASGLGFLSDNFETYNLAAASTAGIPNSNYSKAVLLSTLARIGYSYADKYLFTASFRADGSSKFSKGQKWGQFPSAAVAWRVSEENFLKDVKQISDLKLRASWGATGSQAIGSYATLSQMQAGKIILADAVQTSFAPGTRYPGDLRWETTEQLDLGIDLSLLANRLTISADYYIKNTKDLLNTVQLPSSMGFRSTIQNIGAIQNKGVELHVSGQVLTGAFRWAINSNVSFNRNKVVRLYNGEDIFRGSTGSLSVNGPTSILREGHPIGSFFGFRENGYDEDGFITFEDLDGNGSIDNNDRTFLGDPNPGFFYGFSSNMAYKNFEFDVFLQGSYGNDLYNASKISYAYDYGFGLNMIRDVLYNHWSPENTNAKYPKPSYYTTYRVSDRFIEDGSYLRVKNIQLSYNLPVEDLNINWIQKLQLYVSGQNLWTLTRYSGWDPEANALSGSSSTTLGIDDNRYPMARSLTVGIRARF